MRTSSGLFRPNMTSSFEKPKTNEFLLSISARLSRSGSASERSDVSSRPPKPAPSTTTRVFAITAPAGARRPPGVRSCARQLHDAQVRLHRLPPLRVFCLRLVVGDRAGDDHVVPRLPIHG